MSNGCTNCCVPSPMADCLWEVASRNYIGSSEPRARRGHPPPQPLRVLQDSRPSTLSIESRVQCSTISQLLESVSCTSSPSKFCSAPPPTQFSHYRALGFTLEDAEAHIWQSMCATVYVSFPLQDCVCVGFLLQGLTTESSAMPTCFASTNLVCTCQLLALWGVWPIFHPFTPHTCIVNEC